MMMMTVSDSWKRRSLFLILLLLLGVLGQDEQTCPADDPLCQAQQNDCRDVNELCPFWAHVGECQNNPGFMMKGCRMSCEVCTGGIPHLEDGDCQDLHPQCSNWASQGECVANPGYMQGACKPSCNKCINTTKLREDGIDEETILKRYRYRYASESFGVEQQQPADENEQRKVKETNILVESYALHNVTLMPLEDRSSCTHNHEQCVFWASIGECEKNIDFMLQDCPLACRYCGEVQRRFQKCRLKRLPEAESWLKEGDLLRVFRSLAATPSAELALDTGVEDQDDPWVIKWENFLSDEECDHLVAFAKSKLDWVAPKKVFSLAIQDYTRRVSTNAYCDKEICEGEPALQRLRTRLLDLIQASSNFLESFEFVRYSYLGSFGVHHDFDTHDTWMPAGPRVLSVFLCLTDIAKGGSFGFPDADWVSIKPKKGQLLIWPNVLSSDPTKPNKKLASESLPVLATDGEKYGIHTWVRFYDYEVASKEGCV